MQTHAMPFLALPQKNRLFSNSAIGEKVANTKKINTNPYYAIFGIPLNFSLFSAHTKL